MKARPILFSTPMVQAILDGRKTQTRRVVKPQPMLQGRTDDRVEIYQRGNTDLWEVKDKLSSDGFSVLNSFKCPYGQQGDVLWVRESFLYRANKSAVIYKADLEKFEAVGVGAMYGGWKPSIHMPKEAARIWLKITNVRVERLQDISEEDAIAEGVDNWTWKDMAKPQNWMDYRDPMSPPFRCAYDSFCSLWDSINGEQSWNDNPCVWVVEFERIDKPENI